QRRELLDHSIDRRTGLDHDLGLARTLEGFDELIERFCENEIFALPAPGLELVYDIDRSIVNRDRETPAFHVQNQVFAHDGESDEANVSLLHKGSPNRWVSGLRGRA